MTIRITLYDDVAKQKHTEDFGSDLPAILYAQSKLSSLDTRWTKFKAEDIETGLVLAGPCTLAEWDCGRSSALHGGGRGGRGAAAGEGRGDPTTA